MGLLDVLFGKTKVAKSNVDSIFAMATAYVTLEARYHLKPTGKAAVCFRPISSSFFDEAKRELDDLLRIGERTAGTAYSLREDEYGYIWVILEDQDFEDIVTGVHQVSQTLTDHGYQDRLLAAVFSFAPEDGGNESYWVYAYKQGRFYPFAPVPERQRDSGLELRLSGVLDRELPIQKDKALWYPFWGIPF